MCKKIVVEYEVGDNLKKLLSHMVIVMQKDHERSADIRDVMVALMKKLEFANTEGFSKQVKKVLRSLDL